MLVINLRFLIHIAKQIYLNQIDVSPSSLAKKLYDIVYKWIIYFHHLCALLRCWADVRAPSYFVSLMLHSFFPPTYCHCSYLLACPTCNWVLKQKTIHDQTKWKQSVYIDKGICTQDFKEVRKSSVDREVFIFWLPDLSLIYWITRIYFYFFGIST